MIFTKMYKKCKETRTNSDDRELQSLPQLFSNYVVFFRVIIIVKNRQAEISRNNGKCKVEWGLYRLNTVREKCQKATARAAHAKDINIDCLFLSKSSHLKD